MVRDKLLFGRCAGSKSVVTSDLPNGACQGFSFNETSRVEPSTDGGFQEGRLYDRPSATFRIKDLPGRILSWGIICSLARLWKLTAKTSRLGTGLNRHVSEVRFVSSRLGPDCSHASLAHLCVPSNFSFTDLCVQSVGLIRAVHPVLRYRRARQVSAAFPVGIAIPTPVLGIGGKFSGKVALVHPPQQQGLALG